MKDITIKKGDIVKLRETGTTEIVEARIDRIVVGQYRTIYYTIDGEQYQAMGSDFRELMARANPELEEEVGEITL